jgi:sigma-B regulation protein RsbU (phosphoserine phosphatase)
MHEDDIFGGGPWTLRLERIVEAMRDISRQSEPQALVRTYRDRLMQFSAMDGFLSVSRRGLEAPQYLITRSSLWEQGGEDKDPWTERDQLPVMEGGVLGELLFANAPRIVDELSVPEDDPAAHFLAGMGSLASIPVYDGGEALNMVVQMRRRPHAFDPERLPQMVWMTNLFARATHNLVTSKALGEAHATLAAEHEAIGAIQRGLLPSSSITIPRLELAVHNAPLGASGGDYHDIFEREDGTWGILVADVSGHGAPAAVLMAITHAIAHLYDGPTDKPSAMLSFLNEHLSDRYTSCTASFVTALYGVFDPETRRFIHAVAGHPRPRFYCSVEHSVAPTDAPRNLPLGVERDLGYVDHTIELVPGDRLLIHTDGLNESRDVGGDFFGHGPADELLRRRDLTPAAVAEAIVDSLKSFTGARGLEDDCTFLVAEVS